MLNLKNISKPKFYCTYLLILAILCSCNKKLITSTNNLQQDIETVKHYPIDDRISFSGFEWKVTNALNEKKAPGNNYWRNKNVWVDQKGYLHLTLTKDTLTNKWYCAQLTSEKKFGYGLYQFWIEGRVDQLDKNVVFGLFNYSGVDYYDEIDIEFSRWGDPKNKNLHYSVYPREKSNHKTWTANLAFSLNKPYSLHQITRTNASVKFESFYGFQAQKGKTKLYTKTSISDKAMPIYLNLWSFKNTPPSDNKNVELIVQKFMFTE